MGVSPELVAAAVGGLLFVMSMAYAARKMFGGHRDEVIERLERTTHGMDLLPIEPKAQEKTLARIASIFRPFARLAKPNAGEELSRLNLIFTPATAATTPSRCSWASSSF